MTVRVKVVFALLVLSGLQHSGSAARMAHQAKVSDSAAHAQAEGGPSKYISGVPIYGYEHFEASALLQGGSLEDAKGTWIVQLDDHTPSAKVEEFCKKEADCECLYMGHPSEGGLPIAEVMCTESAFGKLLKAFPGVVEFSEHDTPVHITGHSTGVTEEKAEIVAASADMRDGETPRFGVQSWSLTLKDGASAETLCAGRRDCARVGQSSLVDLRATQKELEEIVAASTDAIEFHGPKNSSFFEEEWSWGGGSSKPWGIRRIQSRSGVPSSDSLPSDGGAGVNVYVLDTGIRTTHTDFGGRAKAAFHVSSDRWGRTSSQECSPKSTTCAKDGQGHGTHCAGTVAGSVYGVAKGATVHGVKVLGDDGSGSSAGVLAGIDWVSSNAIKPAVASMSLGGPKSNAENRAVQTMKQAGITVVVAAGNENTDACTKSPASSTSAITVGSTQQSGDRRSSFSNWGSCLNIFAPGSDILSATHSRDSGGVSQSGTSMACPHVSGAAALILGKNAQLTPDGVQAQLLSDATPNIVVDHKSSSANLLLFTGTGSGPSSPSPTPTATPAPATPVSGSCPSWAKSPSPDSYNDCSCPVGRQCYRKESLGYYRGCPYSQTGYASTTYFDPTCSTCECM